MYNGVEALSMLIYPIVMYLIQGIEIIRDSIGEPFDKNKYKYHSNDFDSWQDNNYDIIAKTFTDIENIQQELRKMFVSYDNNNNIDTQHISNEHGSIFI